VKTLNIHNAKEKIRWNATKHEKKTIKIAKTKIKDGEWEQKSNLSQLGLRVSMKIKPATNFSLIFLKENFEIQTNMDLGQGISVQQLVKK